MPRGKYFALLDADDLRLPYKLEHQVEILESHHEADMVYGAGEDWYSWTGKPEDTGRDSIQDLFVQPNRLYKPPELFLTFLQIEGATPGGGLVRRQVAERIGGFVEAFRGAYEDQVFFSKLSLQEPIFVSSECFFKYRRHPNASCAVPRTHEQICSARLAFLSWLEDHLSKTKVTDRKVKEALRRALDAEELRPYRYPRIYRIFSYSNRISGRLRRSARLILPAPVKTMARRLLNFIGMIKARVRITVGRQPLSQAWGLERGLPIHRYYFTQFLEDSATAIRGHCLEFQKDSYACRFGGPSVTKSDILHLDHSVPNATIIAELTKYYENPDDCFDCIICTHELQYTFELDKAVSELYRILKPGGTLLVANPYINVCDAPPYESPPWIPFRRDGIVIWRLTPEGLSAVLDKVFGGENVTIRTYGNSLTAAGGLRGLTAHEFTDSELNFHDPRFPVVVCARATKQFRAADDARGGD